MQNMFGAKLVMVTGRLFSIGEGAIVLDELLLGGWCS